MTKKISALTSRTQFGQIMNRAIEHPERFLVRRSKFRRVRRKLIDSTLELIRGLLP